MKSSYLDCAATTEPNQNALKAAMPYLTNYWHNPSALYGQAQKANQAIELARKDMSDYIKAKYNEIYFTSGGSESNCWAIQGFIHKCIKDNTQPVVITSKIEHKSIMECIKFIHDSRLADVYYVDNDCYGYIDLEHLKYIIEYAHRIYNSSSVLVSIQFANNEIGTIQRVKDIAKIVHDYGGIFHTDAVQAVGNISVNVKELDIDMLSASAHKFGGTKGNGFLYIKDGVKIEPLIFGTQNNNMRGGTENVAGIVAMAHALKNRVISTSQILEIKGKLIKALYDLKPYRFKINAKCSTNLSLPSILSITILEDVTAEAILYLLDLNGIQVSSGSACNSRTNKPSYVLSAIGLSDWDSARTFRISFNASLTDEQIDYFVKTLKGTLNILVYSKCEK